MRRLSIAAAACVLAASAISSAQAPKTFKARLTPVPIDLSMQSTVAGLGSASALLTGSKLAISGTFDGLKSPATTAQLHKSPIRGVRGPVVVDLAVSRATSGTIGGSIDLTPAQIADLQNGRLYLQLHSEKAPDGNLWGWFMPDAKR